MGWKDGRMTVLAAGTLPWRRRRGELEVALVHRPRYDDWAWAKGKVDPGELFPVTAVRETREETGHEVRLGRPLPTTTYTFRDSKGRLALKEVRYWAAEVTGGTGTLDAEVDEVAWLPAPAAAERLSYPHDRDQLDSLVRADEAGRLSTWSLAVVRHAKAQPRKGWTGDDQLRPLDDRGRDQAVHLVPLLAAYGLSRLISSPSVRAADTLAPYAVTVGQPLRFKPGLSEEGFAEDPGRAVHHVERLLERGTAAALCSHGPVLPALAQVLRGIVDPADTDGEVGAAVLDALIEDGMDKGEVLVAHLVGTGLAARVVAVERHHPGDTA